MSAFETIYSEGAFWSLQRNQINANFLNCLALANAGTQTITTPTPDFIRHNGMLKFINRPTTDAFCVQAKSEFTSTNAAHALVEATCDWKAAGTTGGGIRALQGVARLMSTFTATGGSLIGVYGQVANNGTFNGAGLFAVALYGLIEDGGVYTAVDHVAALWLDSHLAKTVSAGKVDMVYITNNGTTHFNDVFYIYGGNGIDTLFAFDTCGTMIVKTPGAYSSADGYIAILVDGSAMRIPYFAGVD